MGTSSTEQFVRDLNNTWVTGDYDNLAAFFDPAVVMSVPGQAEPITGVQTLLQSYREFGASGHLYEFIIDRISVFNNGPVEVCHLDFSVDYELDGARMQERGRDVYVVMTNAQQQKAVIWRTQHDLPQLG